MTDEAQFNREVTRLQDALEDLAVGHDRIALIAALGGTISSLAMERAIPADEVVETNILAMQFLSEFKQTRFWSEAGGFGMLRFLGYAVHQYCYHLQTAPEANQFERLLLAGNVQQPFVDECGSMETPGCSDP